jgi:ectoine hydroxylase-related dioxygenase (phytanoyl-CoA dioxygenase family)
MIERVPASVDPDLLCQILERDGACVVDEIVAADQLRQLNRELDDHIAAAGPGLRSPTNDRMVEFYGRDTVRIDGLPAKSDTFVDIMQAPLMHAAAQHFLLPSCEDYLFNTGQLIQIGPGETEQRLHRDEDAWGYLTAPKPQLEVEAMFALSDFTVQNGATRVVPGSHHWPPERDPTESEIEQAEMVAGSALFYLGSVLHGGGANRTGDQHRRGMFLGYVVGWLRTEENTFLTVPLEHARKLPRRVQELLGYKAHSAIGVVDVGDPMTLLTEETNV